jgi:HlyD family secretion protein
MAVRLDSTRRRALVLLPLLACAIASVAFWRRGTHDGPLVAVVTRGALTAEITTSGTLRPIESITYYSPLAGREVEVIDLAPEGMHVNEGDLLVRLDATELNRDVEKLRQERRQAQLDLEVAVGERQDAQATLKTVSEGEGALTVEEARGRLQLAQKKVEHLRQDYEQLKPLLDKGFMTRSELARTADGLEQAEEELALAQKRMEVIEQVTHPRDEQRAALQLAQKTSQLENVRARVEDAESRLKALQDLIDGCRIYARRAGMVVYDDALTASPRRKVRVGDRVSSSQGLVTIPEVNRMLVDASVGEADVHRVHPGQAAVVHLEAFPDLRLTGTVTRVGTLARASLDHPLDDKRFDLIVELAPTTAELRPEMTARADIVVGRRDQVLLIPITAVFGDPGGFVAHVVGLSGTETRPIELGESNDRMVEVVAGLREHDRVLLADQGRVASQPAGGARGGTPERERGFPGR